MLNVVNAQVGGVRGDALNRASHMMQKIFFTSKFSYLPDFWNPTHNTETETANKWETTNSKPPRPIIMIGQSESGSSGRIRFTTVFSERLRKRSKICRSKTIMFSSTRMF
jgi:hypothetical protein